MKERKNEFWRLDLLETKFTNVTPRFKFTKKLINAHNNSHLLKKLPDTRNEALRQIQALKSDLFQKKYHGAYKKLSREVSRMFKQLRSKIDGKEHLEGFFNNRDFLHQLVSSRLAKLITNAILITSELKANPPPYLSSEVLEMLTNKADPCNPSAFFVKYCQSDKAVNGYVSKLWNSKEMKLMCSEVEWTFQKIRGNLSKEEVAQHNTIVSAHAKPGAKTRGERNEVSDDSDSDNTSDLDGEMADYDQLVAGSDDGDVQDAEIDNSGSSLEPDAATPKIGTVMKEMNLNVNELSTKKLPQLATGYFSGGSDDESEVDNDRIVKEATTLRKNRRGQRARQKIWEQKYGQKANHIQQESKRIASERERKQQEFEERQRKRDLKAKLAAEAPEGSKPSTSNSTKLHPSWEARKVAEQKQKDVKFRGKKIVFD